jgi:SAM-dependent methyltransferase
VIHAESEPSALVTTRLGELGARSTLGPVVDLACGAGRNAIACASAGLRVIGVDRDPAALAAMATRAQARSLAHLEVRADLECGRKIPIRAESCSAVLVFRFLFRPIAAGIEALLRPGGLLIYETFTVRQRALGYGPKNPAFLLEPGELPQLFPGLEPLYVWEGRTPGERPNEIAQLVARKPLR